MQGMTIPEAEEPIRCLEGLVTDDGWRVGTLVQKKSYQTGSFFSVGYLVQHQDGRQGFLKALDFRMALSAADPIRMLEHLTGAYNFERDVLALCRGASMSKIVTAITDGSFAVPDAPLGRIFYLIFELADGDIRRQAFLNARLDAFWSTRAIHNIAVGLQQLHSRGVYHQDLKPSNVLVFGTRSISKLADLGRAHCLSIQSPHDHETLPGVVYYAPPEQLYAHRELGKDDLRGAGDLYLLGSMLFFLFTGGMLTPFVLKQLRHEHRPPRLAEDDGGWQGYFVDVLPYLREGYSKASDLLAGELEGAFRYTGAPQVADELLTAFQQLSEPDPLLRGHPTERRLAHSNKYNLSRYVSVFDRVARMCEYGLRRADAEAASRRTA